MNTAIKIARKPYILLSSFSAIAASARYASSKPEPREPSPPNPMTSCKINNLPFPPSEAESIASEHSSQILTKSQVSMLFHLYHKLDVSLEFAERIFSEHLSNVTSTANVDAVIDCLLDAELSPVQVSHVVCLRPAILLASVPSSLPELEVLRSILPPAPPPSSLVSPPPALAGLVTSCAASLGHSPSRLLSAIPILQELLLNERNKVFNAIRRCPELPAEPGLIIARNADIIRHRGLKDPAKLAHFIHKAPMALILSPDQLEPAFSVVQRELGLTMGEDVDDTYIKVVALVAALTEEGFMERIEILRRFGFKDEDLMQLFRRSGGFLKLSARLIERKLEFLRDEVGFVPGEMAYTARLGLEKWMIPRHNLVKALMESGLISAEVDMLSAFLMSEQKFKQEFVCKFREWKGEPLVQEYSESFEPKRILAKKKTLPKKKKEAKRMRAGPWSNPYEEDEDRCRLSLSSFYFGM